MTDIVERLEKHADIFEGDEAELMRFAAKEIVRLREITVELVGALEDHSTDDDNKCFCRWLEQGDPHGDRCIRSTAALAKAKAQQASEG